MRTRISLTLLAITLCAAACGTNDQAQTDDDNELITKVLLTFTPTGGGTAITAAFDDPDGPGGNPPTVDPISLAAATTYTGTVQFFNGLQDPAEDITHEVSDESYQHQVFFTGTAVNGPASDHGGAPLTHTYVDMDENGLPIGLTNTFVTQPGSGELEVTLRHLPALNGVKQKTADLSAQVKATGFGSIAGSTDAQVTFQVAIPTP